MKISEIIKEEYENIPDEQVNSTLEPYMDLIKEYIDHGTYIYRGMRKTKPVVKLDASKLNRKARNTYNISNILTSYLPSWEGWPARNKSIPMSTLYSQASSYGSVYVAIPLENQKIGICMKSDFWENFPIEIDHLNNIIRSIIKLTLGRSIEIDENDPDKIISLLDKVLDKIRHFPKDNLKNELINIIGDRYDFWVDDIIKAINLSSEEFPSSAKKWLDDLLNPNFGCELVNNYKEIPPEHNKEVWFSGKILLIHHDLFKKLADQLNVERKK